MKKRRCEGLVSEFSECEDGGFLDGEVGVLDESSKYREVCVWVVLKLPDDAAPCFDGWEVVMEGDGLDIIEDCTCHLAHPIKGKQRAVLDKQDGL